MRPDIPIEIRWCPAHKGIAGSEKADEWAKVAAEKPDTHGVEWQSYRHGDRTEVRAIPLPRSLANLKREISEKKWAEARQWAGGRTFKAKYRMPKTQKPDGVVAGSIKRLASRFYQIKTGHCLTGQYLNWTKDRPPAMLVVPVPDSDARAPPQGVSGVEGPAEDPVGGGTEGDGEGERPVEDPGPLGGPEGWAGGTRLSLHHGCGKADAGRGGE